MEISSGKGNISAIAVNSNHKLLACGFNTGVIMIFQSGNKPKFITSVLFEKSVITIVKYSFCGYFLAVLHDSGYFLMLNSNNEPIIQVQQSHSLQNLLFSLFQTFTNHNSSILTGMLKEPNLIDLQVYLIDKNSLESINQRFFEIEGKATGLDFHCSGNYLVSISDIGAIYIFD